LKFGLVQNAPSKNHQNIFLRRKFIRFIRLYGGFDEDSDQLNNKNLKDHLYAHPKFHNHHMLIFNHDRLDQCSVLGFTSF